MLHTKVLALVAIVAISLVTTAQAQPYRCTVGGKTVYQDKQCEGGKKVDVAGAGVADFSSPGPMQARAEVARLDRAARVGTAIQSRQVGIGMAADDVVLSWGAPTHVNTTITANTRSEQWVYRHRSGRASYVYIEDGRVRTIQAAE